MSSVHSVWLSNIRSNYRHEQSISSVPRHLALFSSSVNYEKQKKTGDSEQLADLSYNETAPKFNYVEKKLKV